ncbi:MAG: Gfo/Idh/MocA family oxidoreductase [Chloroflexota bacterium]|nr:Gfo/Idh/MocA family oxidoreductase [Chloroflexota bacterium]
MVSRVNVALIGAGLMGSFHAETLARRVPGARLAAIVDANVEGARRLAGELGLEDIRVEPSPEAVLADPSIRAVAIATPARFHAELIVAAARVGKPVFCEKPLAHTLEEADRALAAVERAGTFLQIGFQRRFDKGWRRAYDLARDGTLGDIHLLRSITRDPAVPRPEGPLPWAIFLETMIHDFDVLRWLAGSEAAEVSAMGGALGWKEDRAPGFLDTAVASVRFASGALGAADVSFQAAYGYDVRAEVFGTGGMVAVGDGRVDSATVHTAAGVSRAQAYWFKDLFADAYVAELAHFVACVRTGTPPAVTGADGRASLAMALAAIESAQTGRVASVAR